ncbi:uncharacterized protein C20orf96-like [Amphiura filiformis]|uniref:uncharacterized protein C20orf96-like n=1 Tax=Amphiura filiformis TaxID=82378 RepID=UPI003B21FC51
MAAVAANPDEELWKSLGTNLTLGIKPSEYNQWQRRDKAPGRRKSATERVEAVKQSETKTRPGSSPTAGGTQRKFTHFAGPACGHFHGHGKKAKGQAEAEEEEKIEKDRQKEMKVLELLIKSRKKALDNYKARQEALLNENTKLREAIQSKEKEVHQEVKGLLLKYERYRGAVTTINAKFEKEKSDARKEYNRAKAKGEAELQGIQAQVEEVEDTLRKTKVELGVLMSYKDKEYPVRAMRIAELQRQIEYLTADFEDEHTELEHIIAIEREKYAEQSAEALHRLKATVTEEAIDSMHESLKDMALQNMVMKKEIDQHLMKGVELEKFNEDLVEELRRLKHDPTTNVRHQMFPHLFKETPKCTPDMDVVLDIPTQEWLPI